jgi:hypothetical protein
MQQLFLLMMCGVVQGGDAGYLGGSRERGVSKAHLTLPPQLTHPCMCYVGGWGLRVWDAFGMVTCCARARCASMLTVCGCLPQHAMVACWAFGMRSHSYSVELQRVSRHLSLYLRPPQHSMAPRGVDCPSSMGCGLVCVWMGVGVDGTTRVPQSLMLP